jgi:hypothetical protein
LPALLLAVSVHAGPLDWLHRKKAAKPPPARVADNADTPIALAPGTEVRVPIDAASPVAKLGDDDIRYLRFTLTQPLPHARIEVRVTTQRHSSSPRFTVLAPQLVILDGDGGIRKAEPLQPLSLDIEPFRRTELHGCMRVDDLGSFLVATDPSHVGRRYEFNARAKTASHPDHGFYSVQAPMNVFLMYADSGEVLLRVVADADGEDCQETGG